MKVNLTSNQDDSHNQSDSGIKLNENNPADLRKVIQKLIQKSKSVIHALQVTVNKLQKVQKQKDYWKNNYFRFRQLCQKYIDSDGIQHFKQLAQLEQELKKLQVQKQCLIQQSRIRHKHSFSLADTNTKNANPKKSLDELQFKNSIQNYYKNSAQSVSIRDLNSRKQTERLRSKQKHKHSHHGHKSINTISYNDSPYRSQHKIFPKKKLIKIQAKKQDKIK